MADHEEQQKDYLVPLPHEEGVMPMSEGAVVSVIEQAEINQQIATAKRYPRSVNVFRRKLYEMVTIDVDTAESCLYAVPRDGKMIEGPSIRFAELLLVGWGNNRASTEVTAVDEEFIVASGMFFDLEANSAIQAKVMRRITGKPSQQFPKGKRFGPDMIATTGNAACSIALRNAILRGVPKALWQDILGEAKKVAAGDASTFRSRRDKVMKELGIQGATPDQIFALLGIKGIDDMQTEHIVHLKGLQNAIRDGETTVDDAFGKSLKPGEVAPAQPQRSDFERNAAPKDAGAKQASEKPAAAKTDAPAQAQEQPAAVEAAQEEGPKDQGGQGTAAPAQANDAFEDWYKDAVKETAGLNKVREVADHREAVMPQLEGYPAKEKEFAALCDARTKEILEASKKPRK